MNYIESRMKFIRNKKVLLSLSGMLPGYFLWMLGTQLMEQEVSILHTLYAIAGAALLFISEWYLIRNYFETKYLEQIKKGSMDVTGGKDTATMEETEEGNSGLYEKTPQIKSDRKIITLYSMGIIAGIALSVLPVILWNTESSTLSAPCILTGMGIFGFSLLYLEMQILKRKRPELLRRREIKLKDERNIIIRDKAGAKTLIYLWSMLGITYIVYKWFNVEYKYEDLLMIIICLSSIIYFAHMYYYKKRI